MSLKTFTQMQVFTGLSLWTNWSWSHNGETLTLSHSVLKNKHC